MRDFAHTSQMHHRQPRNRTFWGGPDHMRKDKAQNTVLVNTHRGRIEELLPNGDLKRVHFSIHPSGRRKYA